MSKKKPNHLHKFKKVILGTNKFEVFRCLIPGCSYYINVDLAENAICQCNRCGDPMILDKTAMVRVKPHCIDCTRSPRNVKFKEVSQLMEKFGS